MLKNLPTLCVLLLLLAGCTANKSEKSTIFDPGSATSKTYNLEFNTIEVNTGINAEVIKSDEDKVIITAPENLLDKVSVQSNHGNLKISFNQGFRIQMFSSPKISATIYVKDLSGLKATSSAAITLRDRFTQEKMNIEANSSGEIFGDVQANQLDIKVSSSGSFKGKVWAVNGNLLASSSGDLNVSGEIKNITARSSSSGTIDAKELKAATGTVSASSSGDVSITISQSAVASASSSGDVVIYKNGNPTISKSESSSGSVSVR